MKQPRITTYIEFTPTDNDLTEPKDWPDIVNAKITRALSDMKLVYISTSAKLNNVTETQSKTYGNEK